MYAPYRRAVQFAALFLVFFIPVLNLFEIYSITGTFYAINIGSLGIADPVVILQALFASGRLTVPLLGAALFPVIFALLFGRVWCGWICPYHLMADGAAVLRRFLRARLFRSSFPEKLPVSGSFKANVVRFGFLMLGTVIAGAVSIPVLNYVHAPGIISTEGMIFVKERTVSPEVLFIVVVILLELTVLPRFWCRLFCPTGAFISLFRARFTLRIENSAKNPKAPCCTENHCSAACPMGLAPYREGNNLLCTNCTLCVDSCLSKRLRFGGFRLGA
ncbi:MAG: 4Fe-4S binding protein [Desulfomonile tiedjei]|uniref:4Fe-4S binding protein n=1 Tax=Desulfomonile tiedjei TaxID=2358 RepID=A0A9D6V0B8_9BACT|nr:4Fe-4S binding protein [Desulfomonile tiedjei]